MLALKENLKIDLTQEKIAIEVIIRKLPQNGVKSKHLKGWLGPPVSDVTFFNHRGRLGPPVSDVTFFNHGFHGF